MDYVYIPLADKLRPTKLRDVVGQEHITSKHGLLNIIATSGQPTSMILWGPPGTGKTTIARILAAAWHSSDFIELSAVTANVKDIRSVIDRAQINRRLGQLTVLFVDEVHRFTKSQQDVFLPHIESGLLILIGATTENPSFEVNNALLSRTRVVVLKSLDNESLKKLINKAAKQVSPKGIAPSAVKLLIQLSGGDGRIVINTIELAAQLAGSSIRINDQHIKTVLQRTNYQFDKNGDIHYDLISACIKSLRGGDAEAALYYTHRLLSGGEDPLFITRRLIIFASEDIGLAAPYALTLALAAFQAVERLGMPESEYVLSHVIVALARSPKSRETTDLMMLAKQQVQSYPNALVPLHLRNAPTKLMEDLGYNKEYEWKAGFKHPDGFLPKEVKTN